MTLVMRPRYRRLLPLLIISVLIASLAVPADAAPVAKKVQSRTAKKKPAPKKRTKTSTARRSKPTRSKKTISKSKRRGKKSKWARRTVRTTPAYNHSGVHNYLTQAWSNAHTAPARQRTPAQATTLSERNAVNATFQKAETPIAAESIVQPRTANDELTDSLDINPLVLAYTSSLETRGLTAENQGFIVSTFEGEVLAEHNADRPFNPASVVKLATSLVAISRLGPDFRYRTSLYTDGTLDPQTGILSGSLYVIGSGDPAFLYENAFLIADKLNQSGIREVTGDLVVLGPFHFNFSAAREISAKGFRTTLSPDTWTAAAKTAFPRFLSMRAAEKRASGQPFSIEPPSLKIAGKTITDSIVDTRTLRLLAVHTSLPLVRLLKGLNDFSNNWMAAVIGNMVGGPPAVQRFLKSEVGLKDDEVGIVTASGLGSNYISPRGTIQILQKLMGYLRKEGLSLEEMLPVAGVDAGTLEKRFTDAFRGSVVAKTGTLRSVSALAGVAYTRSKGPLLFVIYNRGGSNYAFRSAQDETIRKLITFFGGPSPVRYVPSVGPAISERSSKEGGPQSPSLVSPK